MRETKLTAAARETAALIGARVHIDGEEFSVLDLIAEVKRLRAGPRIPAHGSPEWLAMVRRIVLVFDEMDVTMSDDEELAEAALRAAFPEEGE